MNCRYCGSTDISYLGIDDGGGDYGDSICDSWECNECGAVFEADCIELLPDESEATDG